MYYISRESFRIMLRLLGGLKFYGTENVPKTGGFIVASNHISYLDPPAVACGVRRQFHFMAKRELYRTKYRAWWMYATGTFPVNRGSADRGAIKRAIEYLNGGDILCLFPEGTRSPDGKLQPAEMGVGMIALKSRAPIVPAAVIDTDKALPPSGGIHRHPMKVVYGKPLTFPDLYESKDTREAMEEIGRRIMAAIGELQEKNRH